MKKYQYFLVKQSSLPNVVSNAQTVLKCLYLKELLEERVFYHLLNFQTLLQFDNQLNNLSYEIQFVQRGNHQPSSVFFVRSRRRQPQYWCRNSGDGRWNQHNLDLHCPMIKEWKNKKLKLCNNQCKTILRSISGIKFSDLKEIFIYRNGIESIEGFSRIQMPELRHASLSFNRITSIRDLRKSKFPGLKRLGISDNTIRDRQSLVELKTDNKFIAFGNQYYDRESNDARWIIKCQMILQKVALKSLANIQQKPLEDALKQRYPDIIFLIFRPH